MDSSLELMKNYYYLYEWNPSSFPNYVEVISYMEQSLNIGGCIDNLIHKLYCKINNKYRGHDIAKKLKILKKYGPHYQELTRKLIQYRNKIIHKGHIDVNLIQNIAIDIIALYTADNEFCDIDFFNDWNQIYNLILQKAPPSLMRVDNDFNVKEFYSIFSERWDEVYDQNLM